ncbi:MAG: hypothetical protein TREMPRED_005186 [Tremellales sp. Tagirdzhanova-0007]|nr:MAG: hypothetical protein TREMPRED_005186 [Tremellales sp. Tagirdzhanova-0007]
MSDFPPRTPPATVSSPSASSLALLSLTQDITALISLSLEATASLVHDWFRSTLDTIGLGEVVAYTGQRKSEPAITSAEGNPGLAVVVVGAGEATGQSLTLHLARSGYTVFPLVPLPSPNSPPTSAALSSLLLTWSGVQKRLRARFPSHSGAVVPVITDPESSTDDPWTSTKADLKGRGRFAHAGETVRAYCRENRLELVAIVCAARGLRPGSSSNPGSPRSNYKLAMISDTLSPPTQFPMSLVSSPPAMTISIPRPLHHSALAMTDEQTLISLYWTNVLDPLSVIRELSDLLSAGRGRGRVVFVNNGGKTVEVDQVVDGVVPGATQMVAAARGATAKLLRKELGGVGIDVCEVVVGPMSPRIGTPGYHLRQRSDDIDESDIGQKRLLADAVQSSKTGPNDQEVDASPLSKQAILAHRIAYLSRIWAVDDALLFSAVRRAIEDRYPRYRHHAGLSPLLKSLGEVTPGSGIVRVLGRWVVGRLLMPRGGAA